MPYEDKESYTIEEIADFIVKEAQTGTEALRLLQEHGFELKAHEEIEEATKGDTALKKVKIEETVDEEAPPVMIIKKKRPGPDMVALRISASEKALGKHKHTGGCG
jgi:hypothetical protein